MQLFTIANPKTAKGEDLGYLTAVLHLAPHTLAGHKSVCPNSTPECRKLCLYNAGRGVFEPVQQARINRTLLYFDSPRHFASLLVDEAFELHAKAKRAGLQLAVRVNGTSDLPSLARAVARELPPDVQCYDYTKIPRAWAASDRIHYTFSRSETNERDCALALREGVNVAVVFDTKRGDPLPLRYVLGGQEAVVIDGDRHDLRFLDPKGVIVGLRAKGPARKAAHGFVTQATAA
jgi:hypothetical protein